MILIGLGSNLGKREEMLATAIHALIGFDVVVEAQSAIHETPALLPPGAPPEWNIPYLNQVISVSTHHTPLDLLACLKHIEAELGRASAGVRWAPREIDLDLLSYGDVIYLGDTLTLPHPELDSRLFVLKPLMEIAPNWRHPVFAKTPRELLAELAA